MKKRMTKTITIPAELVSISTEEEKLAKLGREWLFLPWKLAKRGRECLCLRWLVFLSNLISFVGNLYAFGLTIQFINQMEASLSQLLWFSPSLRWYLSMYVGRAICFGIALRTSHKPSEVSLAIALDACVLLQLAY
jgi:hypothetical protein